MRLDYDEAVSNGRPLSGDAFLGLAMRLATSLVAPQAADLAGALVWTFPEDPVEAQRVLDATAVCPVTFGREMNAAHIAAPSQVTCLRGVSTVLDSAEQASTRRDTG